MKIYLTAEKMFFIFVYRVIVVKYWVITHI